MKKILNILSILLLLVSILFVVSCEDKPKTPEKTPQEETQEKIDDAVIEEEAEKPSVSSLNGFYSYYCKNNSYPNAEKALFVITDNKIEFALYEETATNDATGKTTYSNQKTTIYSFDTTIDDSAKTIRTTYQGNDIPLLSGTYTLEEDDDDDITLKITHDSPTNYFDTFKKLTNDGTTLSLATKENTLGSWGRTEEETRSDGTITTTKTILNFKEDKVYELENITQSYNGLSQASTSIEILQTSYFSDGVFKITYNYSSGIQEEYYPVVIINNKYLYSDDLEKVYSKVPNGGELVADPDNNPINGKRYTPPTVTDKAEGLYFDVGDDGYDVDLLSNGNALLIDRGNIINGTYTVETSGDISINAGDNITLNIPNGDRDDKKKSDDHLLPLSSENELNGLWYLMNEDGTNGSGIDFNNGKVTIYMWSKEEFLMSSSTDYTYSNSEIIINGDSEKLYKVGSHLFFSYELFSK